MAAWGGAAAAPETERLDYRVSYQGFFSGGAQVDIATARLTLAPDPASGLLQATLTVTSEPFPAVDALLHFRFHYRSWFDRQATRTSAVNMWRISSRPKRLALWFDRQARLVRRFERRDRPGQPAPAPPEFLRRAMGEGDLRAGAEFVQTKSQPMPAGGEPVLDRLTMLYALRARPAAPGEAAARYVRVANGKDLNGYRVTRLGRERLRLDGAEWPAVKLRFVADYADPEESHAPVLVWFSDDARRLPLRFLSDQAIGRFELTLTGEWAAD